jgi:hypothetical protein
MMFWEATVFWKEIECMDFKEQETESKGGIDVMQYWSSKVVVK